MTRRLHEDEIEMERRHIREAEEWVARQEEIVVRLDLTGSNEVALLAHERLVHFRKFVAFARERLDYLEKNRSGNAPE
jgi:non-ribosomal peptide synthetase component F